MDEPRDFPLESIRTDGWFERIAEGIGSFQALCDIVGERFFAFSMILGARITALTVDRRNPDNTLVDFSVAEDDGESTQADTQRLTLADFRRRLVSRMLVDDQLGPLPERETDTEALQLHIGVRHLLLAPLYGYSLTRLRVEGGRAELLVQRDGMEETFTLEAFRGRMRAHVREELERVARGATRSAIDLARVSEAEAAAAAGDSIRVLELLGAWPAPLAIFLRTPEGQALNADARATIARGLGLLGSACAALGEVLKGEEVLRLAVQYAGDGPVAGEIYARMGRSLLEDHRAAEAIGPLRRAANLGAPPEQVWPQLARAFAARGRFLAALGAIEEGRQAGVAAAEFDSSSEAVNDALGDTLGRWRQALG
ncbi:MAG: hypothetical protein KIT72_14635 [Polyangiaceae bacterium]|nr:hypothetical protein [Polyangiaceae bacterium]MCW5791651.1 hypothetical protein [Polyangiaceae bacterium]